MASIAVNSLFNLLCASASHRHNLGLLGQVMLHSPLGNYDFVGRMIASHKIWYQIS